jgi:hypothetical protein
MGEIVDLRPVDETLEFGGKAASKRDWLIGKFAKLAQKLNRLTLDDGSTGQHSADRFQDLHREVVALQTEYAEALLHVTSMAEVCEAVHCLRDAIVSQMPDKQSVVLWAANGTRRQAIQLSVERRGIRFLCSDFEIFEVTENGNVAAVFGRYAAA